MNYQECITESAKYRELTTPFCRGCGLDIASQGDPVVPWAWNLELPAKEFREYNSNRNPYGPIQLNGYAHRIPVASESLDFVYCSHLLEDFTEWIPPLREWTRLLRKGGRLIVLIPEKTLWAEAIRKGQPDNAAHKHLGMVGELSKYALGLGLKVVKDELTNLFPGDYTILFVGEKA